MLTIDNAKLAIGEQFTESTTPAEKYAILRAFEEAIKDLYEEVTEPSIRQIMATKEFQDAAKVGGKTVRLYDGTFTISETSTYDFSSFKEYQKKSSTVKRYRTLASKHKRMLSALEESLIKSNGLIPVSTTLTPKFSFDKKSKKKDK